MVLNLNLDICVLATIHESVIRFFINLIHAIPCVYPENIDKRFALSFGFCYNDYVHQDDEKEEYIRTAIEERKRQVRAFMANDGSCFGVLRVSGVKRVSECACGI